MQEPQHRPAPKRFSDEQARVIYERAAQIESKTLFGPADDSLSRDELEAAANRAGISDSAIEAAIKQLDREVEEQKLRAAQTAKTRRQAAIAAGALGLVLALSGVSAQRNLSSSLAVFEIAKGNTETAEQRRHDLLPNIAALAKANLSDQKELGAALSRPDVDKTTIERAKAVLEARGVQIGALDELVGTDNRIYQARRRWNESAAQYNARARSFPTSLWRGVFGFPSQVEGFKGDAGAKVAPKF